MNILSLPKQTLQDQIAALERGLPATTLEEIAQMMGLPKKRIIAALRFAERTIQQREKSHTRFTLEESERMLRILNARNRPRSLHYRHCRFAVDADPDQPWEERLRSTFSQRTSAPHRCRTSRSQWSMAYPYEGFPHRIGHIWRDEGGGIQWKERIFGRRPMAQSRDDTSTMQPRTARSRPSSASFTTSASSSLAPHLLYTLEIPDELIDTIKVAPFGWKNPISLLPAAQALGNQWYHRATSPALLVPSAVTAGEHNLIVRSGHPALETRMGHRTFEIPLR